LVLSNREKSRIQDELVEQIPSGKSGRLLLAPRTGKSRCMVQYIKREKPQSILWVTPSRKLADEDIPSEFDKWKAKRYKSKLSTTTYAGLRNVTGYFDLIILDEDQYLTELNTTNLLNQDLNKPTLRGKVILGMTGTDTKHESKHDLYKSLGIDEVLIRVETEEAVEKGIVSDYEIHIVQIPMNYTERNVEVVTKKGTFTFTELKRYMWLDDQCRKAFRSRKQGWIQGSISKRRRFIINSPSKKNSARFLVNQLKGRKLVFCGSIELAEYLGEVAYHSDTDDTGLKKFLNKEANTLGLVNSGGTGYTYREIDHLVLVQADSDKTGLTSQKIFRTLLSQKNYKGVIWILVLEGTQDEIWVNRTLERFDKSKIQRHYFKNLAINGIESVLGRNG